MNLILPGCDNVGQVLSRDHPWKIRARIIRLWNTPHDLLETSLWSMEMILQDAEGERIHAVVSKNHPIRKSVVEGLVYKVSLFKVISNVMFPCYTRHEVSLLFDSRTRIFPRLDRRIQHNGLVFMDTESIIGIEDGFVCLPDIIGLVTAASSVKVWIRGGMLKKRLVIDLQDNRGSVRVLLRGDNADEFNEYLCSNWTQRPVLALQFVKIKIYEDKLLLYTIPPASKIYVNPTLEEVVSLTNSLIAQGVRNTDPVEYIWPKDGEDNIKDDMLNMYPRKTVTSLIDLKEKGTFVVHGAITNMVKYGHWSYPSCRCYGELIGMSGYYECKNCGSRAEKMMRRFRVMVDVFDGYDTTIFVMNDPEVRMFLKMSCEDLIKQVQDDMGDLPDDEYPAALIKGLEGKELLFKVRNDSGMKFNGHECFDVVRVIEDPEIIDDFRTKGAIPTPRKAVFVVPFTDMDCNRQHNYNVVDTIEPSLGFAQSSTDLLVKPSVKRKLLAEFQDDNGEGSSRALYDSIALSNVPQSQSVDGVPLEAEIYSGKLNLIGTSQNVSGVTGTGVAEGVDTSLVVSSAPSPALDKGKEMIMKMHELDAVNYNVAEEGQAIDKSELLFKAAIDEEVIKVVSCGLLPMVDLNDQTAAEFVQEFTKAEWDSNVDDHDFDDYVLLEE